MTCVGCLKFLPFICGIAIGYTVDKGGPFGYEQSRSIDELEKDLTNFLKQSNISLPWNPELAAIWSNTSQILKNNIVPNGIHATDTGGPREPDCKRNAVWLGNIRGNRYTTKHVRLQPTDHEFWQWSFDEMGKYDVPVMIDYVLSRTGHQKLDYIGHSEGTTNLITSVIIYGSSLAEKINKFVALAPAIYVGHAKGLMRQLGAYAKQIQKFWDHFQDGDIFSHEGWISKFAENECYKIPNTCSVVLHSLVGTGLAHFNLIHPDEYDLSLFTVPTYAFFGKLDWLVSPPDAEQLIKDLPNLKSASFYSDYNHLDFVWGYNIADTLYRDVLQILES